MNPYSKLARGGTNIKIKHPFSHGRPKGVNPVMTTNTVTASTKGDPQLHVEGKKRKSSQNHSHKEKRFNSA